MGCTKRRGQFMKLKISVGISMFRLIESWISRKFSTIRLTLSWGTRICSLAPSKCLNSRKSLCCKTSRGIRASSLNLERNWKSGHIRLRRLRQNRSNWGMRYSCNRRRMIWFGSSCNLATILSGKWSKATETVCQLPQSNWWRSPWMIDTLLIMDWRGIERKDLWDLRILGLIKSTPTKVKTNRPHPPHTNNIPKVRKKRLVKGLLEHLEQTLMKLMVKRKQKKVKNMIVTKFMSKKLTWKKA